jgi:hypothetical protein
MVLCNRVPLQLRPRIPQLQRVAERVGQSPAVRDGVVVVVPGRRRRVLRCGRHGAVVLLTADAVAVIVIAFVVHLIRDSAAGDVAAAARSAYPSAHPTVRVDQSEPMSTFDRLD